MILYKSMLFLLNCNTSIGGKYLRRMDQVGETVSKVTEKVGRRPLAVFFISDDKKIRSYYDLVSEHQFDKREMTDSDFDFYPGNWKNPLGYTHFCFWNHQNPLFGPQNSPLKF